MKSRSCCRLSRIEGAKEAVLVIYPTFEPPATGVRLNPVIVTVEEIASQIGASSTKVIKVPPAGLGVVGVEEPQLVRIPVTSAIAKIFARVRLGIRLKGLLLFTSGIGTRLRLQGDSGHHPGCRGGCRQRPAPLPQMMSASNGVIRTLGLPAPKAKLPINTVN